ncbi:hypothetical protein A2Z33_01865 [Candidatus Gottesmanbacteria bacterium RBG_16_52_11]|uniref:Uncharacterized protein n=1 Tax=Candidatus Gottesmanbacteria bacterium RBG_16_52_11 TaxID=1798374 RepID=A0A1F5YR18_9BACT|nr:MAG: hypothetical protein A2Z33_01865 [Candidatus Gottesmanbacteria bacterium RBG_16_52_11]
MSKEQTESGYFIYSADGENRESAPRSVLEAEAIFRLADFVLYRPQPDTEPQGKPSYLQPWYYWHNLRLIPVGDSRTVVVTLAEAASRIGMRWSNSGDTIQLGLIDPGKDDSGMVADRTIDLTTWQINHAESAKTGADHELTAGSVAANAPMDVNSNFDRSGLVLIPYPYHIILPENRLIHYGIINVTGDIEV